MTTANNQIANQASTFLFIVRLEVETTQQVAYKNNHLVDNWILNIKVLNRQEVMGIFSEKAGFQLSIDTANWYLSLIAVGQRLNHAQCLQHFYVRNASDFIKAVLHLLAFKC